MRGFSLARFAGLTIGASLLIWAAAPPPAQAQHVAAATITVAPDAILRFLLPVGGHGHHGHWGHRRGRWSRDATPYGAAERDAIEAPAAGYAAVPRYAPAPGYLPPAGYAPAAGAAQPVAPAATAQNRLNRGNETPPQTTLNHDSEASAAARPSIQWVNPDHAAR